MTPIPCSMGFLPVAILAQVAILVGHRLQTAFPGVCLHAHPFVEELVGFSSWQVFVVCLAHSSTVYEGYRYCRREVVVGKEKQKHPKEAGEVGVFALRCTQFHVPSLQ